MVRNRFKTWRGAGIALSVALVATSALAEQATAPSSAPGCAPVGPLVRIPAIPEGSGVAASRRSPGRLWTHNDSGKPELVALDADGTVVGRVTVSGARIEDWESIAIGPCPNGSCIYIGDIGDNDAERAAITIYRLPEPENVSGVVQVGAVWHATYPDGPHDAEALLVTPDGDVLIATKGRHRPMALYRVPMAARGGGGNVTLELVSRSRETRKPAARERITDGTVSPTGAWIALRTETQILLYPREALMSGTWPEARRIPVKALGEPQGEGIAFGDERTLYLVGEGGGKRRPGTFGRLTCSL